MWFTCDPPFGAERRLYHSIITQNTDKDRLKQTSATKNVFHRPGRSHPVTVQPSPELSLSYAPINASTVTGDQKLVAARRSSREGTRVRQVRRPHDRRNQSNSITTQRKDTHPGRGTPTGPA